jgi:hypothetical protein
MLAHIVRQVEQAQRVRHMLAALADLRRHRLLRAAETVDQRLVGFGFLDWIQIGALDVFDDRDLEHFAIVHRTHDCRNCCQPRAARSAPAAFAGDDLEHVGVGRIGPHQDRLQHALGADRLRQLLKLRFAERAARLLRVWNDAVDRDLGRRDHGGLVRDRARGRFGRRFDGVARASIVAEQGRQPASKPRLFC